MSARNAIDRLRARADRHDALAARARLVGDAETADELERDATEMREIAGELEGDVGSDLPAASHTGKSGDMVPAARLRISKSKAKVDPLTAAANAAGLTLRSLAERIGCSHAHLYQARRGSVGMRTMWAQEIERLTGFAASKANWPGGLI